MKQSSFQPFCCSTCKKVLYPARGGEYIICPFCGNRTNLRVVMERKIFVDFVEETIFDEIHSWD